MTRMKRLGDWLTKYQGAITFVSTALMALIIAGGWGFRTPQSQLNALEARDRELARRDTAIADTVRAIVHDHEVMMQMLRILTIDVCLRRSTEQQQLMQLPCTELLNPRNRLGGGQ